MARWRVLLAHSYTDTLLSLQNDTTHWNVVGSGFNHLSMEVATQVFELAIEIDHDIGSEHLPIVLVLLIGGRHLWVCRQQC